MQKQFQKKKTKMMNNFTSVIAAVSTPPGKGGVAIIRISGDGALEVASSVFIPRSKRTLSSYPTRMQVRGDIFYSGELIDDGMATYFKSPASYTGEDTVEIACCTGSAGRVYTARLYKRKALAYRSRGDRKSA